MAGEPPPPSREGKARGTVGTEKCPLCNSQLTDSPALPLGDIYTHHFNVLLTYFLHTIKTQVIKINFFKLSSNTVSAMTHLNFVCENLSRASVTEILHLAKDQAGCTLGDFLCGYFLKALRTGNNLSNAYECFFLCGPVCSALES